jgi:hypothetical protein
MFKTFFLLFFLKQSKLNFKHDYGEKIEVYGLKGILEMILSQNDLFLCVENNFYENLMNMKILKRPFLKFSFPISFM